MIANFKMGEVSIPIGICLFAMMYPALLNLKLEDIKNVINHPKAIVLAMIGNWVFAPLISWSIAMLVL